MSAHYTSDNIVRISQICSNLYGIPILLLPNTEIIFRCPIENPLRKDGESIHPNRILWPPRQGSGAVSGGRRVVDVATAADFAAVVAVLAIFCG
jgi:hypothetical protein